MKYAELHGDVQKRRIKSQRDNNIDTETGLAHIFNGEIGRYESCRFVEQTFIPKGGAANATAYDPWGGISQAWTNGLSSWAFFCGGDTVTEAVCVPEEIRAKIPKTLH